MLPEGVPQELIDILDKRAGKKHSRTGVVISTLAEILTQYDEIRNRNSLKAKLEWLNTQDCTCDHEFKGLGRLYGISIGEDWVRTSTNPDCRHHGDERKE